MVTCFFKALFQVNVTVIHFHPQMDRQPFIERATTVITSVPAAHEALQILIEYEAALSVQDTQGRAPIHWACAAKDRGCLRVRH